MSAKRLQESETLYKGSDKEYAMLDRKVTGSQRRIVVLVLNAKDRGSRDHFGNQYKRLVNDNGNGSENLKFSGRCFEVAAFMYNRFIIAAWSLSMTVTGGKLFFHFATFGFRKQGYVLNRTHANVHSNHEAGG